MQQDGFWVQLSRYISGNMPEDSKEVFIASVTEKAKKEQLRDASTIFEISNKNRVVSNFEKLELLLAKE